jgi:2'-5' RNA ligase
MQYLLVHVLSSPAREWVDDAKEHIITHFDVSDIRGIAPHITLKYYFDDSSLSAVEGICLAATHKAVRFRLEGFGNFGSSVLFLNALPSAEMIALYHDLAKAMQKSNVPFDEHEKEGIHFHATLAAGVRAQDFEGIMNYLNANRRAFSLKLDNLTILKYTGDEFVVHRTYELRG